MRVGIDFRPAILGQSGIARYTRQLAVALDSLAPEEGLELSLFSVFWQNKGLIPPPEEIRNSRYRRSRFPGRLLQSLGSLKLLSLEHWTGELDLFHSTDYVDIPRRTSCSTFTLHDLAFLRNPDWFKSGVPRQLTRFVDRELGRSRAVLTVSETSKGDLLDHFDVDENSVFVTPCAASREFFEFEPAAFSHRRVLCIGTLEPRKNQLGLLRAFEKVAEGIPEASLVFVGRSGWLDGEFKTALRRSKLGSRIIWKGPLGEQDLRAEIEAASIVAYPSFWEGFGLPVMEGMASGRAVLTSDLGAMRDSAKDGALLVDPHSPSSLAEGLAVLLGDEPVHREFARKGRKRARLFTWTDCARKTLAAWRWARDAEPGSSCRTPAN